MGNLRFNKLGWYAKSIICFLFLISFEPAITEIQAQFRLSPADWRRGIGAKTMLRIRRGANHGTLQGGGSMFPVNWAGISFRRYFRAGFHSECSLAKSAATYRYGLGKV